MGRPLTERVRPQSLQEFVGQEQLAGEKGILSQILLSDQKNSFIFYGPPGTGKTTLARILGKNSPFPLFEISGTEFSSAVLRSLLKTARPGAPESLFIDEIHRLNKAQQDHLLGPVENGSIILYGATTENPGFSINKALLSRVKVLELYPLSVENIKSLLLKGGKELNIHIEPQALDHLSEMSGGDARYALNYLENLHPLLSPDKILDLESIKKLGPIKRVLYDKSGEFHYDLISALHKSIRGSDIQASLYWLGRMVEGGEDPLFLFRRLLRCAMEDIGLADPKAVEHILSLKGAYESLGFPEGRIALVQAVVYLASAPKSNRLYLAEKNLFKMLENHSNLNVPDHLKNAPTSYDKEKGIGKDYQYPFDFPDYFSDQNYFPDSLNPVPFYLPGPFGFEKEIRKRVNYWDELKIKIKKKG